MTTDSGLVYLSGLLRAGAEPLSPTARRRPARPPHEPRVADYSEDDDEAAEGAVAVNSSEATGDRYAPSPDVPHEESAVKSLPDDMVEGVEQHVHAEIQSRAVPSSSTSVRAASAMNGESRTPAASPTAPVAGEARNNPADDTHSPGLRADEMRGGETEQSPAAGGEAELIPATPRHLDVGQSPATPHREPNDSAVTQSETVSVVEGSPRRASKAKTTDEVAKTADEESAAHGASLLLPVASSVRGSSARRDTSARVSQASPEKDSPTFAGDRARVSEGGASPADASAEPAAGSAPFTLEAHVEHLRALMRTARAETPDDAGGTDALRPPSVVASHSTKPLTTAARPTREQPRAAPRAESEARPETPTPAPNSGERQPAVLVNQESPGALSGLGTSATLARPATPRAAWAQRGGVSPARVRSEETTRAQSAHVTTAGASPETQDSAPAVAPAFAPVAPAPSSEGAALAGVGRAPKLTINRLDVQVVRPPEPPPEPPPHEPPASESPPRSDPWGALDRQHLGRFSY